MDVSSVSDGLFEIMESFNSTRSREELCGKFNDTVNDIGEFHYAVGLFKPRMPRSSGVLVVNYPGDWQKHYYNRRYIDIDPTIDISAGRCASYTWEKLRDLDTNRRRLFDDLRELGVSEGLTVPIRTVEGSTFVASFAARTPDISRRFLPMLTLVSAQFLERHNMFSNQTVPVIELTPRERDCLSWTARGKSAWEIGVLLGISENTVNFHIKNACAKLDSNGRMLCVVKALMLGLISP